MVIFAKFSKYLEIVGIKFFYETNAFGHVKSYYEEFENFSEIGNQRSKANCNFHQFLGISKFGSKYHKIVGKEVELHFLMKTMHLNSWDL